MALENLEVNKLPEQMIGDETNSSLPLNPPSSPLQTLPMADEHITELMGKDLPQMEDMTYATGGYMPKLDEDLVKRKEYIDHINLWLNDYGDQPHTIVDGKKVYAEGIDFPFERECISLFFEAVNYDKQICDLVSDEKNGIEARKSIMNLGYAQLALAAKGRW